MTNGQSYFDKLVLAAAFFIVFLGGYFFHYFHFPLFGLQDAIIAAKGYLADTYWYNNKFEVELWQPASTDQKGLVRHDPQWSQPGYTLYTSTQAPEAYLLDNQGHVVHKWHFDFVKHFPIKRLKKRFPHHTKDFVYIRSAQVMPNGDLIAVFSSLYLVPWGLGMVKLDQHSHLKWAYIHNIHHDFDVDDQGNIYTLTHSLQQVNWPDYQGPMFDDALVVLSPQGKKKQSFSIYDAIRHSHYKEFLSHHIDFQRLGKNFLHTNSVQVISPKLAQHVPYVQAGDVVMGFRNIDAVVNIDPRQHSLKWLMTGPWAHQHDAHVLDNGNLLVFNNHDIEQQRSAAEEWDPSHMRLRWRYQGQHLHHFYSKWWGRVQRLANGNTLINDGQSGRILEVTPQDKVVWEYVTPVRARYHGQAYSPVVMSAHRYQPQALPFLQTQSHNKEAS